MVSCHKREKDTFSCHNREQDTFSCHNEVHDAFHYKKEDSMLCNDVLHGISSNNNNNNNNNNRSLFMIPEKEKRQRSTCSTPRQVSSFCSELENQREVVGKAEEGEASSWTEEKVEQRSSSFDEKEEEEKDQLSSGLTEEEQQPSSAWADEKEEQLRSKCFEEKLSSSGAEKEEQLSDSIAEVIDEKLSSSWAKVSEEKLSSSWTDEQEEQLSSTWEVGSSEAEQCSLTLWNRAQIDSHLRSGKDDWVEKNGFKPALDHQESDLDVDSEVFKADLGNLCVQAEKSGSELLEMDVNHREWCAEEDFGDDSSYITLSDSDTIVSQGDEDDGMGDVDDEDDRTLGES